MSAWFPYWKGSHVNSPSSMACGWGHRSERELGVMQAEGFQLKYSGDPEACRGFSPVPPTRAGPGIPWKPEQVKASSSPPLPSPLHPSKSWILGQPTTPPKLPSPTGLHRPSLIEVGRPAWRQRWCVTPELGVSADLEQGGWCFTHPPSPERCQQPQATK